MTKQGFRTRVRTIPMNWLRRRVRARRGYLRFLVRAQYVGFGINAVFLLLALVAAFHTRISLPENARNVIWWIPVIGFPVNGAVISELFETHWRVITERL